MNQRTFVIFFASTKVFFFGAMTLAPGFGARIDLLFRDVSLRNVLLESWMWYERVDGLVYVCSIEFRERG